MSQPRRWCAAVTALRLAASACVTRQDANTLLTKHPPRRAAQILEARQAASACTVQAYGALATVPGKARDAEPRLDLSHAKSQAHSTR